MQGSPLFVGGDRPVLRLVVRDKIDHMDGQIGYNPAAGAVVLHSHGAVEGQQFGGVVLSDNPDDLLHGILLKDRCGCGIL